MDHDELVNVAKHSYAWVRGIEAWTVAVIADRSLDEVVRIYGGDPNAPVGDYFFSEAVDLQGPHHTDLRFHLQVLEHAGHVVALENNGWSGSHPEIARRCSAQGGHFFSVYWNVIAFGMLTEAVDGRITACFEFLYPVEPDVEQGTLRPDWAIGPEIDVELARQVDMALLQQRTGVRIDPCWLTERLPTYRIPNPDALLPDATWAWDG